MRHALNLWRQELGEVPDSVWQQTELRVLILADNGLTTLPPGLGRLHRLTTLDLGHNALTSIPDELGMLTELNGCLYLHDNQLSRIPDAVGKLTRLDMSETTRALSQRCRRLCSAGSRTTGTLSPLTAGRVRRPEVRPGRAFPGVAGACGIIGHAF
jgi:hypothetical protein